MSFSFSFNFYYLFQPQHIENLIMIQSLKQLIVPIDLFGV
jgi:hypothetical protein